MKAAAIPDATDQALTPRTLKELLSHLKDDQALPPLVYSRINRTFCELNGIEPRPPATDTSAQSPARSPSPSRRNLSPSPPSPVRDILEKGGGGAGGGDKRGKSDLAGGEEEEVVERMQFWKRLLQCLKVTTSKASYETSRGVGVSASPGAAPAKLLPTALDGLPLLLLRPLPGPTPPLPSPPMRACL